MDGTESIVFEIKLASSQNQPSLFPPLTNLWPRTWMQTKSGEVGERISAPKGFPALKATALFSPLRPGIAASDPVTWNR